MIKESEGAETAGDAREAVAPSVADGARGLPVSLVLHRRLSQRGAWPEPVFDVAHLVAGARAESGHTSLTVTRDATNEAHFHVAGLRLSLYADGCESYWYNLGSGAPRLFVVCFDDPCPVDGCPDLEITPVSVTASQDEANAHMESDDPVFSVPMPPLAIDFVERFVVAHYVPEVRKKRRRREWAAETQLGAKRDVRGGAPRP